ncbi:hypothetical protein RHSIM_Rhsim10G0093300 [Rhododendron simsii]|uniref:XMAP215/Dis1/CLASP TOG domain-containing protein n=1 Tax=Rhododendron simsii TaxID=118357 RepID=A0A834GDE5_RHOSS|nr:hypothetical protein RHSIM_Rhsim10G0093300 [Rhododendron simsii]
MSTEDQKLLKEAKKLPWEDRLTHKNWKVRNDANVDVAALCDSISDPKDPPPPRIRFSLGYCFMEAGSAGSAGGFVVVELSGVIDIGAFYGSFFRKTVVDSNAPVREKALDALISFLKAANADVGR